MPIPLLRTAALATAVVLVLTTCTDRSTDPPPLESVESVTSAGSVVLVGAGNVARCDGSNDEKTALLLDAVPGTVFTTGDNIHASGTLNDYQSCYGPSWGRQTSRTRPTPGDDDYKTTGAAGYFGYFGAAAGEAGKGYHSYDLGAWHIVVLNSNISMVVGSAQELWLRADLAATTQPCVLAYWHHPRFSSYGTAVRSEVKPLWDALYEAGADVVLNGHYRVYERFALQTPSGAADPERGLRQFTVGTGGHGVQTFGTPRPTSEVRGSGVFGVLRLTLDAGGYAWEYIPIAGQTFTDTGSGTCHGRPGGPPPNQAPSASPGGPYQAEETVTFDGSGSEDPDNNLPLTYAWTFGDGTTDAGVSPVKTYGADGTYTVSLVVTDALGVQSAAATTTAIITNMPPVVNAGADGTVELGTAFTLDATFSDPGGALDSPWGWSVAWRDGTTETGSTTTLGGPIAASHVYQAIGQYTVLVTVTDKDGGDWSDDVVVTVTEAFASAVLVGAGNVARCDGTNDEQTALLLDEIPGTIFTTGNNIHANGTLVDYQDCYGPSWGRHAARTRPTPGDDDYATAGGEGYFGYFGSAAGEPGKGYHSYDLGAWHIVVLNSGISTAAGSAQEQWLKADLAATTRPCVLAYWHHPRFSSYATAVRSAVKPLWDALYAAQADVVLNGRYRLYERFAPQTPTGEPDPERGLRQFTVGTGGHGFNSFGTPRPNSVVRASGVYGVLKMTLSASSYSWAFVPIAGQSFTDAGTGACHGRPGGAPPNQRPAAVITAPAAGMTYRGGDVITYGGSATDPEDGVLPPARLSWWADFHHDTHTHPFLPVTAGIAGGTISIPTASETADNVWYRFYLVAVDAQGVADTVFRDVQPQKVTLALATEPAGLQVTLDGQPTTTPLAVTGVVGIDREIGAVSPQTSSGIVYSFSSWSDGGAATHTINTPPSNTTLTAAYTATHTNTPPVVALTAPATGGSAPVNTPVTVTADASDPDGTVTVVEFFDGALSLGTDASSPYSIIWMPLTTGPRSLTARATDNFTAVSTSAVVAFTVTPPTGLDNEPPMTSLISPVDRTTGLTGALTLSATATDNVGVVGVQFQMDGESLGPEDASAPYGVTLPATSAYTTGVHVLRARARDAAGNISPWAEATVTFGNSVDLPAGFSRTTYTSGLLGVTAMAFAPDGRLFICQQNGEVRVVPAGGGAPLSTPFHAFTVTNLFDQGLLGIAFHPNFSANGFVYVYYTSPTPTNHNRVSRVVASGSNPNVSTGVETILLDDLPTVPTGGQHNGGALHFSPRDGKLYIAIGEQGFPSEAQSMTSRFGKMLRLNDDGTLPADNPFMGTATGVFRAIWALGLRNPFTFAFQPQAGRMFINDVGATHWEEIDEGVAGSNYGWPTTQGPTTDPRFRSPLFAYRHPDFTGDGSLVTGFAIVGGTFYNPAAPTFPASYVGSYFFADYVEGWINRLDLNNGTAVYAFARIGNDVFDLDVGPDGALYALARGSSSRVVYRYQFP